MGDDGETRTVEIRKARAGSFLAGQVPGAAILWRLRGNFGTVPFPTRTDFSDTLDREGCSEGVPGGTSYTGVRLTPVQVGG